MLMWLNDRKIIGEGKKQSISNTRVDENNTE